jgi:hypothetical protein
MPARRMDVDHALLTGLRRGMFLDRREVRDLSAMLARMHPAVGHEGCTTACELLAEITHQRATTLSALAKLLELLGPPQLVEPGPVRAGPRSNGVNFPSASSERELELLNEGANRR